MNGSDGGPQPSKCRAQLCRHGVLPVSYCDDLVIIRTPRDSTLDFRALQTWTGESRCGESELRLRPEWILSRQTLSGVDPRFIQGRRDRRAILELRAPVPDLGIERIAYELRVRRYPKNAAHSIVVHRQAGGRASVVIILGQSDRDDLGLGIQSGEHTVASRRRGYRRCGAGRERRHRGQEQSGGDCTDRDLLRRHSSRSTVTRAAPCRPRLP
jgi:hypothetical protein